MKNILITAIIILFPIQLILSQSLNWQSLEENQSSILYANFGYQFGVKGQLGYGYKLNSNRAIILSTDISLPMGAKLLDDFQFRLGGQAELFNRANFTISGSYYAIARRHETDWVKQLGIASELSLVGGYYKPNWHLAAEFGIDKSLATKINHGEFLRNSYPEIKDAWYLKSGGNLMLGLQGSRSLGARSTLHAKLGVTNALGNHVDALVPFYFQVGFIYR